MINLILFAITISISVITGTIVISSLFSRSISEKLMIDGWGSFFSALIGALVPLMNIMLLCIIIAKFMPKLPKPKHW